jgi:hypothetical protein
MYLSFEAQEHRDALYKKVEKYMPGSARTESTPIGDYSAQWADGKMSNFEYLSVINSYAQRSS